MTAPSVPGPVEAPPVASGTGDLTYLTCQHAIEDKHSHRDCQHAGTKGRQGECPCDCWCHVAAVGPAVTRQQVEAIFGPTCPTCHWTRGRHHHECPEAGT